MEYTGIAAGLGYLYCLKFNGPKRKLRGPGMSAATFDLSCDLVSKKYQNLSKCRLSIVAQFALKINYSQSLNFCKVVHQFFIPPGTKEFWGLLKDIRGRLECLVNLL